MKKMGKNKNINSMMNSGQFGDIQSLMNKKKTNTIERKNQCQFH